MGWMAPFDIMSQAVPTGPQFEEQVRAVARALWPKPGDGAAENIAGRERDCLFPTEDLTHYIECTTRRDLDKVRTDVDKMAKHREQAAKHGTLVKLWFVTYHEPTADQRSHGKSHRVEVLSLDQFRRKLVDGHLYLSARDQYAFGSATDPRTDSTDLSSVRYQPTTIRARGAERTFTVSEIAGELSQGRCIALVGDFGMGKSLTVRELYKALKTRYARDFTRLPVTLNLRDHWGQTDVAEALHRHANKIGFGQPHQLVRAFNAGLLLVLLDGFDETAPTSWNTKSESRLRDLRRDSVRLVAEFVRGARGKTGILVTGRQHFFDSEEEMRSALALRGEELLVAVDEFSDSESKEFLEERGFNYQLPDWLPRRPLLLAHLAAHDILQQVLGDSDAEPDGAWDSLVDLICEREALIHKTLDAVTVRAILERLATSTRSQSNEGGAISAEEIARAFRSITGAEPDELARPLLNRLPGLGVLDPQKGTRTFIDGQMLDVLRAGDVARFVDNPWEAPASTSTWQQALGSLGIAVASRRVRARYAADASSKAKVAATAALERHIGAATLAADAIQVARETADNLPCNLGNLRIDGATFTCLDLAEGEVVGLTLVNCEIGELILPDRPTVGIAMSACVIHRVSGCANMERLPEWITDVDVGEFDAYGTNAQILDREELPMAVRVAMTILRKLYLQRGRGRKENALFRGIGHDGQRWVSDVLALLSTQEVVSSVRRGAGEPMWHSVAGMRARVVALLDAPTSSQDPIAISCRGMKG